MATTPPNHRPPLLMLSSLLLLLLVHPFHSAATPSITTKAVPRLPGFSGPLPFSLETGYMALDDGVRLFYYFIQSERDPEEDPVLLWLTGGPGCSTLSGLVYEIGPFYFDFHGYTGGLPTLLYKPASWTKRQGNHQWLVFGWRSGERGICAIIFCKAPWPPPLPSVPLIPPWGCVKNKQHMSFCRHAVFGKLSPAQPPPQVVTSA